ncbi:hypothetical protein J437_LFUL003760 [Ladona fulva]|uniref:RING-type E3 ubiquitin transferase n=1 Tax=Ladona fulva TaxID=123851 RepID=A0A8K0JWJ2_LADFU|nr:hypothetical protein J437_LFUL003760 [Ladona fulva]
MASANESAGPSRSNSNMNEEKERDEHMFECNICLDTARDGVVSIWPCLHQWFETRPHRQECPVCKAAISKEKVIPLYGRGNTKQEDPRNKIPPRPPGQRTEPENNSGFPGFGFGDGGFQMSFGIGAFPFGYFTSTLNFVDSRPNPAPRGTVQFDQEYYLSKAFIGIAVLFLCWLLYA